MPPTSQLRRPYLRKRFFVRRHPRWGAAVCWYEVGPISKQWGVSWGLPCNTVYDAKVLRRFLNARVARFPTDNGVPFSDVVWFITGSQNHKRKH